MSVENGVWIMRGLDRDDPYLVITDFHRRVNKRGEEYGMPVSVMLPPEAVRGYERVTSAYNESPEQSYDRITARIHEVFPDAQESEIISVIGKRPDMVK